MYSIVVYNLQASKGIHNWFPNREKYSYDVTSQTARLTAQTAVICQHKTV